MKRQQERALLWNFCLPLPLPPPPPLGAVSKHTMLLKLSLLVRAPECCKAQGQTRHVTVGDAADGKDATIYTGSCQEMVLLDMEKERSVVCCFIESK